MLERRIEYMIIRYYFTPATPLASRPVCRYQYFETSQYNESFGTSQLYQSYAAAANNTG